MNKLHKVCDKRDAKDADLFHCSRQLSVQTGMCPLHTNTYESGAAERTVGPTALFTSCPCK